MFVGPDDRAREVVELFDCPLTERLMVRWRDAVTGKHYNTSEKDFRYRYVHRDERF